MSYRIIQSIEELFTFLQHFKKGAYVGYDTETTGLASARGQIAGWALGDENVQIYVPVRHTAYSLTNSHGFKNLDPVIVGRLMQAFFNEFNGYIIGHNIKFDILMASWEWFKYSTAHKDGYNFWRSKKLVDTMILAHTLQENKEKRPMGLKQLAKRLLREDISDEKEVEEQLSKIKRARKDKFIKEKFFIRKEGRKTIWKPGKDDAMKQFDKQYQVNYADVTIPVCGKYGAKDVSRTINIFKFLWSEIVTEDNKSLLLTLEHEFGNILPTACMELRGMRVDYDYFKMLEIETQAQIFNTQKKLEEIVQQNNVNWSSPKQLVEIAEKLGFELPRGEQTEIQKKKGIPANKKFDKNARKKLRSTASPKGLLFLDTMDEYNKLCKLHSSFMLPIILFGSSGIVHGSFNPTGTRTGRYSSSDPNLQNIPKKDQRIRQGFVARPGFYNFYIDYDQMEMRLAAHFTGDKKLISIFEQGLDPYQYLASIGENIPYDQVPKKIRDDYKTVGLAALYGAGEAKLLLMTSRAQQILHTMHIVFPAIDEFSEQLKYQVQMFGYINLLFNRRRRLEPWESYKALNSEIQGSGAMIVKKALREIAALLAPTRSSVFLQLHDEIGMEIHEEEVYLVDKIIGIMEGFKTLVPLTVSAKYTSTNWADKKEWRRSA